jgi:hypothetical protein
VATKNILIMAVPPGARRSRSADRNIAAASARSFGTPSPSSWPGRPRPVLQEGTPVADRQGLGSTEHGAELIVGKGKRAAGPGRRCRGGLRRERSGRGSDRHRDWWRLPSGVFGEGVL